MMLAAFKVLGPRFNASLVQCFSSDDTHAHQGGVDVHISRVILCNAHGSRPSLRNSCLRLHNISSLSQH